VRPFLIWRDLGRDAWGFPLSGHSPRDEYEVSIEDWWEANLHGPGTVRIGAGCPIAKERIGRVIGALSPRDADRIARVFTALFAANEAQPTIEEELNLALA